MRWRYRWAWLASSTLMLALPAAAGTSDEIRLNEIQVIGTHNSYHAGLAPGVEQWLKTKRPEAVLGLDYQHPTLDKQLSAGIRQVEIDIYADSQGGRFAHPRTIDWITSAGLSPDAPWDPPAIMAKPGFKVLHIQDIDYRSNCQPFTACLRTIREWSRSHPGHSPIFILIETKADRPPADGVEFTDAEPFMRQTLDALDAEILSVVAV